MTSAEPLVSVVTPFYNTEEYLPECIESALAQTYGNFEYLLVDNHSSDRSGAVAARYAARDPRIRITRTPKFLTQVQNYNFALEQISAQSRYCKMIQADDWLFPRCLEEMVSLAERQPSVAIVGSYRLIETAMDCVGLDPKTTLVPGREACRMRLLGKAFLFGSPSTLLYRSDIVRARRPFFAEGRFHEDTDLALEVLQDHDFGFVHQVLSFSRRQEVSIMSSARAKHAVALDEYITTKRYGSSFLEPAELDARMRVLTARYYFGLAGRKVRELFGPRDERFWDYQTRGLATIGERVDPKLMAKYVAEVVVRSALAPLELAREARRSFVPRSSSESTERS